MCCWKTNRVDAVTKANKELFDETASTSSTSLVNTMFHVVWPTLVAPKLLEEMRNKPLDLGENSKGYTIRISSGILSNLRLQFTHVGVVQTVAATVKPFYERSMQTWTLNDVRAWLGSGLSMTEERLAELEPLLEKSFFNGASLAVCSSQELEKSFKFTKEESMKIISMRSEYASPDYVKQLVEKIVGAAQSASGDDDVGASDKKEEGDQNDANMSSVVAGDNDVGASDKKEEGDQDDANMSSVVAGDSDVAASDKKEEGDQDDANMCSVVVMDAAIKLSGETYMKMQVENESSDLPNTEVDVKNVTLEAKVRVEIDPTNEEVRIAFFEKPEIDLSVDAELIANLDVPLFEESRWLEVAMEHVLEDFSLDNPIKITLGDAAGGRSNAVTKRSVRRAF